MGHTPISAGYLACLSVSGAHTDKRWLSCMFVCKWGHTQISAGYLACLSVSGAHTDKRWLSCMFVCKWGHTQISAGYLASLSVSGAHTEALVILHVWLEEATIVFTVYMCVHVNTIAEPLT